MLTTFEVQPATKAAVRDGGNERGAALATALMLLAVMGTIAMTVLAVVHTESRIAGSDLKRTQTYYAAAAGIEKMTSDFSALFVRTSRPTTTQLNNIANSPPPELLTEGYTFTSPPQSILPDDATLTAMRATQNITNGSYPRVTMPSGPFAGLTGSVAPYILTSTATSTLDGTQVSLTRTMNNYLIPIFQFGMFSNEDIELHPGPPFTFNGRVHANGNIYVNGDVTFLSKVTTANELIFDVVRNGSTRTGANVSMTVGAINVPITIGSMVNGPNITTATSGQRGYFPGSPNGTANSTWNSLSIAPAAAGVSNQLGGQLQTRTTGGVPLLLPLQLDGNPTREIIKRRMPNDNQTLSQSRYHTTASIRILIDDENPSTTDQSGIPAGQGVALSAFDPSPLPSSTPSATPTNNGGGRALWKINDSNTGYANSYNQSSTDFVQQAQNGTARQADTVRGVRLPSAKTITGATNATPIAITCTAHGFATGDIVIISGVGGNTNANGEFTITRVNSSAFTLNGSAGNASYTANTGSAHKLAKSANGTVIPYGAGITGRVLVQLVDSSGNTFDVTQQILSMGVTEGEPNAIVVLQRPLWAAFTQGSRDSSSSTATNYLTYLMSNTLIGADGEILVDSTHPGLDTNYGFLNNISDDGSGQPKRSDDPPSNAMSALMSGTPGANWSNWNAIVPINVYNVREGLLNSTSTQNEVYERGITSIVELNMRNLARWMDGVYDNNLLAGTNAVSTNIAKPDGYTVYVSDRRGDRVKSLVDSSGATINSTNGMVDNIDIYGPNGTMDAGEDVRNSGLTVGTALGVLKDTTELPDPAVLVTSPSYGTDRTKRAIAVAAWGNIDSAHTTNHNYFRSAVRLFNGENLQVLGTTGKLSSTLGISVASENMVYIWGNYNTTGINGQPTDASTLNDSSLTYHYLGNQVPASIVADAFYPLSKTWFDAETSVYPEDLSKRLADYSLPSIGAETSVRCAIIAGNNLSALTGSPDAGNSGANESRLNGGMHNFPRFLEKWTNSAGTDQRWNFVGSLIPLYHSTQALGQYNANSVIYSPPQRNWAFDSTFTDPNKLPPGTPQFQYIEPTAFRQVL
jgi:hypothetical protein